MTGLVEKQFVGFMIRGHGSAFAVTLPSEQIRSMRMAFFAGAAMYQGQVLGAYGPDGGDDLTPDEEAAVARIVQQYTEELDRFSLEMLESWLANEAQMAGRA